MDKEFAKSILEMYEAFDVGTKGVAVFLAAGAATIFGVAGLACMPEILWAHTCGMLWILVDHTAFMVRRGGRRICPWT